MGKTYSPKQADVLLHANSRWNILCGAVSSGKTYLTYDLLLRRMLEQPPGNGLLLGKTERTLKRNVLDPMREKFGTRCVSRVYGDGEIDLFGRKCYVAGANDKKAVSKIQGITLVYAYGDEVTTWSRDVFEMLKSRLRLAGAKFDGTCNPDNPFHWFKEFLDDEEIPKQLWTFAMDDNPFLPSDYAESMKREYRGMWYKRMILGEWVAAEGAIYGMFDAERMIVDQLPAMRQYWIGVDYGHANATVFLLLGEGVDGRLYAVNEFYHSGSEAQQDVSPAFYARAFVRWRDVVLKGQMHQLRGIFIDPSAKGFKTQLREMGVSGLRAANNAVLEGIQTVSSVLDMDLFRMYRSCRNLAKELPNYVWDKAAQNRGEDTPLKRKDHAVDALRYGVMGERRYWKRRIASRAMIVGKEG